MPRNEGIEPPCVMVDIRYRCGVIVRNIEARTRRWSLNDPAFPPNFAFDIASWQPVAVDKGK